MWSQRARAFASALSAVVLASIVPFVAAADPRPDLVVKSASAQLGMVCDFSGPVIVIIAQIQDIGDAPSPGRTDAGAVVAVDRFAPWSSGVSLPDIAPGASVTVTIPLIAYDPAGVVGVHRFTVTVNRDKKIAESNYKNNQSAAINISVPAKLCGQ